MNHETTRATLTQHPKPWRPTAMADPATSDLDPALLAPEISCRLVLPFLHAIEERAGRQVAEAVVEDAGLPWTYLADANNWVSARWTQAFFLAWAHHGHGLDHEPAEDHPIHDLWYDVGRKSMTPEVLGVVFGLFWAIGSPGTLYTRLPDFAARGNRRVMSVDSQRRWRLQTHRRMWTCHNWGRRWRCWRGCHANGCLVRVWLCWMIVQRRASKRTTRFYGRSYLKTWMGCCHRWMHYPVLLSPWSWSCRTYV